MASKTGLNDEMPSRLLTVILNCAAGAKNQSAVRDRIVKILEEHGLRVEVHMFEGGGDLTELAKSAVRSGSFAVVAGGGDGTVNAVASALVDSQCALAILPLGTLNHFAKCLKIPLDVEKAAQTIATGQIRRVDVGEVNGKVFVNNSSLGLYPRMVRGREREQRLGRSKWVALFWATLATLRRYPLLSVRLISDGGQQLTRRTPVVFIGNNQYELKGFEIGSRPSLDAGKLAVYVAHKDRPATLIRMGLEAIFGRLRRGRDFDFLSTENLKIEATRSALQVATDGEVATLAPPLLYRIRPLALRVIVPVASNKV